MSDKKPCEDGLHDWDCSGDEPQEEQLNSRCVFCGVTLRESCEELLQICRVALGKERLQ